MIPLRRWVTSAIAVVLIPGLAACTEVIAGEPSAPSRVTEINKCLTSLREVSTSAIEALFTWNPTVAATRAEGLARSGAAADPYTAVGLPQIIGKKNAAVITDDQWNAWRTAGEEVVARATPLSVEGTPYWTDPYECPGDFATAEIEVHQSVGREGTRRPYRTFRVRVGFIERGGAPVVSSVT